MQVRGIAYEAREDIGQQAAGDGGHRGDAQVPRPVLGDQAHVAHHAVMVLDQFLGIGEELHAEGRQLGLGDARIALLEQGLAQLAFQVADGQRDGRLGAVRALGRRMETLKLGNPDEVAQLDDLQVRQHGKFSLSTNIHN
ncbi:hypothetical protein D9M71_534880 [compost metagenome]